MDEALVRALGAADAAVLGPHLEEVRYGPGEQLAVRGEDQPWLLFVAEGEVAVHGGADGPALAQLGAPTWLGEVGFADGEPATATVVATAGVRVHRLHRDAVRGLLATDPRAAAVAIRAANQVLGARLHAATRARDDDGAATGRRARLRRALGRMMGAS